MFLELLSNGADVNARSVHGSVLGFAVGSSDRKSVKELIDAGADPRIETVSSGMSRRPVLQLKAALYLRKEAEKVSAEKIASIPELKQVPESPVTIEELQKLIDLLNETSERLDSLDSSKN